MRGTSTPRPFDSITTASGILDHPPARVTTTECAVHSPRRSRRSPILRAPLLPVVTSKKIPRGGLPSRAGSFISALPCFGHGFGLAVIPTGAGRSPVSCSAAAGMQDEAHGERRGLSPKASVRFRSPAQQKDSSVWLEQMTLNHRVAGSIPAPTLRFSLKS
jgi:hypothetical protein